MVGSRMRAMLATALAVAPVVACRGLPGTATQDVVTFAKDVAPIVFERCASCHHPGGSGPFSVLDYDSLKKRARQVLSATQDRVMPPWLPEPGHGEFAGERRLTNAQIDTIRKWVDQNMPEGDRASLAPLPRFTEDWQLGEPDLVVNLARPYTLEPGHEDVWRNFVIPIALSDTRYVKTVELKPGSARFVHHALIAVDEMRSSRRRDERDAGPGFEGMDLGDAHMPDGSLLGWTPGMLPFPGSDDTAWRLKPGTDLVLQLHMMPADEVQTINPAVGLYFSKRSDPGAPTYVLMLDADDAIDVPAGEKNFVVTDTMELPVDAEVIAVYPHAHYIGKSVEGSAKLPDGSTRWLIRINRWDFKWQDVYRLSTPLTLPKGTTVSMRWSYDNSATSHRHPSQGPTRVVAGNRSSDEMAHLQIQMRLRTAADRMALEEAYFRHLVTKRPRSARLRYGLAGALKDQGRWAEAATEYRAALAVQPAHVGAHINLGAVLMVQGDAAQAIDHFRAAIRLEPDSAGGHYNLGLALAYQGRLDEAARHYREAIKSEPAFAEAQNNLGGVLAAQGRIDEAILHYREAVRLLPDSADAHNNLGSGLSAQGKREEATRHFQRALELSPTHADARKNLTALAK